MKKKSFYGILLIIMSILLVSCKNNDSNNRQAKYIFFMIGDGMGLAQTMLTQDYLAAISKDSSTVHLDLLKMPINGYASTYSKNSFVTCSSASGTALSTGHKTNNGMVCLSHDSSTNYTSITYPLHDNDYLIGIITNVSMDHATPACFYAHAPSRSNYDLIASQLSSTNFEYFGGGGLLGMLYDSTLIDKIKSDGYTVTDDVNTINNHKVKDGNLYAISTDLGKSKEIPFVIDKPKHNMKLSFFVKKGIDMFEETGKNFFMMIEGGKIDWASHGNDPAATVHEVIDFDEAFKLAYDFYLKHPEETLIIMTADHETGGLALGREVTKYAMMPEVLQYQHISEYQFNDVIDSLIKQKASLSQVYDKMKQYYGFNGDCELLKLNASDSARINNLYKVLFNPNKNIKYSSKEKFANLCLDIISSKAGIGWTTHSHTGIAVPVRAIGCGAENFNGFYDNTDIPKKIMELTNVPF